MAAKRIRMVHITSKDVLEGNLKSIMRIILALAAHYKPQSVRCPSHSQQQVNQKNQTVQVGSSPQESVIESSNKSELTKTCEQMDSNSADDSEKTAQNKFLSRVPVRQAICTQGDLWGRLTIYI